MRARLRWLLASSRASTLALAVSVATVFLVVEATLVILLKQVDPRNPIGVLYAVLMGAALLANFVIGVAAARSAQINRRREAELAADLARLMLRAGDLRSGLDGAGRRLAEALKLPFAALELDEVAGDEHHGAIPLRNGTTVLGTLLVPADLATATRQRLQQRVVPALTALLAAARDRHAMSDALAASRDMLAELAEQQKGLRRVATLVACGFSPQEVFSAAVEEMALCLNVDDAAMLRYESDGTATVVACSSELSGHYSVGERLTLDGDNPAARVMRTLRAVRLDSYKNASGSLASRDRALGLRSRVGAPIVVEGRLWGAAVVGSTRPEPQSAGTEERTSDFADLVATAIVNATTRAELIASRSRIVAAADDARRRLERDLHDGAQQRLVSLGLQLGLVEGLVLPEQGALKEQLSAITSGLAAVSTDLQDISRGIHPAILSKGGLGPALKTLARRAAVPVSLDVAIERRLPDPVEVAAYYVVAEALTNAAKHARASEVKVNAEAKDAKFCLSIHDDGIGGADSRKGSGLIGLKDRVESLGGQLHIASPPGTGTSFRVVIPLGDKESGGQEWRTETP